MLTLRGKSQKAERIFKSDINVSNPVVFSDNQMIKIEKVFNNIRIYKQQTTTTY